VTWHTGPVAQSAESPVRLLSRSEVRSLLRWPELIEATQQALVALATASSATAVSADMPFPGGSLHLKSGALAEPPVLTVKANLRPDAGGVAGVVLAFDPVRFAVRAIFDSADITAMRTAAVTAVAARELGRPGPVAVAAIGLGPVGRQSITALRQVLDVAEVRLWSRETGHADEVAATVDGPVSVHQSPGEAAAGADVVVTSTPSRQPLLFPADLRPDALVLAMGADTRGKRELGEGVLSGASIVADVVAGALSVGECAYLPGETDRARCVALGELLASRRPRPAGSGRIVFDSVGTAVVDAAVTGLVLELAEREQVGTMFQLGR
jgi:ornithine cyclodeaminase/alanine dehydrogenase-like protein (mu-crystallin family)